MKISQPIILFLVSMILSGCWAIAIPGKTPDSIGNMDLLESLIGQSSEDAIRKLGLPNELVTVDEKQYMLYATKSSGTGVLVLVWVPIHAKTIENKVLHCLRIELNSDNMVTDYQLESVAIDMLVMFSEVELNANCREVFWNKKEQKQLQVTTKFSSAWEEIIRQREDEKADEMERKARQQSEELHRRAEQGETDAQLELFKTLRTQNPQEGLIWLCKSADLGNQEAREILAKTYEFGGHIWIEKGIVERNYKLAYVWYGLSGKYDQEDLQFFADRYLTSKRQIEAKKALKEWQPGYCERDLGLTQTS